MTDTFEKQYVYKTTLRDVYGLTDRMIAELGDPDKYTKNPHWRSGPMASLYLIERVEAWCDANRARINDILEKRAARQRAAKRAVETKYIALIHWAETAEIELEPLASYEDAWKSAETYYSGSSWHDRYDGVSFGGVIAYMRHNCTNYDRLLRQIDGKVGTHEAYQILRGRVDDLVEKWLNEAREAD